MSERGAPAAEGRRTRAPGPGPPEVERLVLGTPAAAAGLRLDRFLADAPGVGTRSQAKRLIDEGRVWVDGRCGKAAQRLRAEARVEVALAARPTPSLTPEPVPLAILYEDDDLVAIDKPAGMVVHPAPGRPGGTLVNALVHRWGRAPQVGHPSRPGIVHRLDRDTSGVLLVARTPAVLEGLARQFRERAVEKHYLALVHGLLRAPTGTIDRPIGRHPRARQRMSVRSRRGRAALTRWTVLERLPGATLVRLEPETGRTHQLRVHLAALGYPIVGDPVYGGRRGRRSASPLGDFPRQALHAEQIGFVHPGTGVRLTVRAPLPPDLEALLAALRQAAATKGKSRGAT